MMHIKPPAVAGFFYPDSAQVLRDTVRELMRDAHSEGAERPRALIAPHAGYQYSGATAACAYRLLEGRRDRIRRVVLLGPAHRVYLQGMALPSVGAFSTPLGDVAIDAEAVEQALTSLR